MVFFKHHPNLQEFEIENLKNYDCVILEGTGFGHFSNNVFQKFKEISKNTKLIITTQCIFGEVNLDVYSNGKELKEIGILGNKMNLISETQFIRSAFILSNYEKSNFKEIFNSNLENFEIVNKNI